LPFSFYGASRSGGIGIRCGLKNQNKHSRKSLKALVWLEMLMFIDFERIGYCTQLHRNAGFCNKVGANMAQIKGKIRTTN